MKKIISIALFALLLNGCDDGDISVDSIEFQNILPSICPDNNSSNSLIFKLKEQESLLLYLPKSVFAGEPSVGTPLEPKRYNIDLTTNRVIYRAYNGKVTINNMCDVIPPATPNVIEEWIATSGVIEITTRVNKTPPDETNGSTRIKGYTYSIIFKDITFNKPSGPQTYESFPFGDYVTTITDMPLTFVPSNAKQCTVSKQIYNFNETASLTIDNIDSSLIANESTPLNKPRTGLINDTTNKVFYRVFASPLSPDYFCQTSPPSIPAITQIWAGKNGVAEDSGIIEVSTTTNGNNFVHTITLKNVSLQKGNNDFNLGNNFVLGTIITTPN
ncbi:hypothetical protein OIU80_06285 [Flavobacterium sp. LS1R47]|jgi:hypothetical protein|uniref:Uncharacterized protein n=1 Tax=Flavobacterium frigoritolerans TaxID=2987686 RepID=A0A9X3C8L2_9FLAO|nr:hypothetical protein [Flavobacterium frigoritolerans]MCV9931888.1 hypothetical protein [Flavobacterium frigoritolerans]